MDGVQVAEGGLGRGGAAEGGDGGVQALSPEGLPGWLALPDVDNAEPSSVGPARCRMSLGGGGWFSPAATRSSCSRLEAMSCTNA